METLYKQYCVTNHAKELRKRFEQAKETYGELTCVRIKRKDGSTVFLRKGEDAFLDYMFVQLSRIRLDPFVESQPDWDRMVGATSDGSRIFYFQSPWEQWQHGEGVSGYLLESTDGQITDGFYTYISYDRKRRSGTDSV